MATGRTWLSLELEGEEISLLRKPSKIETSTSWGNNCDALMARPWTLNKRSEGSSAQVP
jgi:hypothetical protein